MDRSTGGAARRGEVLRRRRRRKNGTEDERMIDVDGCMIDKDEIAAVTEIRDMESEGAPDACRFEIYLKGNAVPFPVMRCAEGEGDRDAAYRRAREELRGIRDRLLETVVRRRR